MKEEAENYACSLEMEGGYHGHPYPQKFVKAKQSEHPSPAPSHGKSVNSAEVMKMCCHAK